MDNLVGFITSVAILGIGFVFLYFVWGWMKKIRNYFVEIKERNRRRLALQRAKLYPPAKPKGASTEPEFWYPSRPFDTPKDYHPLKDDGKE